MYKVICQGMILTFLDNLDNFNFREEALQGE